MWPSKDKYLLAIVGALQNVSNVIINTSRICDFNGSLNDVEKYGYEIEKSNDSGQNEESKKSIEELEAEKKFAELEEKTLTQADSKNEIIKKPILKTREGIARKKACLILISKVINFKYLIKV